jgi:hypothetical protein
MDPPINLSWGIIKALLCVKKISVMQGKKKNSVKNGKKKKVKCQRKGGQIYEVIKFRRKQITPRCPSLEHNGSLFINQHLSVTAKQAFVFVLAREPRNSHTNQDHQETRNQGTRPRTE